MKTRALKTLSIVIIVAASCFFLFYYYLPSQIEATGPNRHKTQDLRPTGTKDPRPKTQNEVKKSIASDLGVPAPETRTYAKYNPKNIETQKKKLREIFTVPEGIKTEVEFWRDIYTKYDKSKVVFHDTKDLGIIYSVIDISDITNNAGLSDEKKAELKRKRVDAEMARIDKTLDKTARAHLRSQTGIRDKFIEGIKASGRYLGEIEKIFAQYGVPLEVTRLAFVESMFNLNALSKSGASGVWQFMPESGRLFLNINRIADERNDPILATHAAAKHLVRDYNELNSWPLAINSYNSGRGRLERAVNRLGTKNISTIIKKYDGPGYSFASRNFYPAFLAALDAFENREKYLGNVEMDEPLKFDVVVTPFFATLPELANYTGTPLEELTLLNFHLQEDVVNGSLPVPKGFELKVPAGRGEAFLVAMNEMNELVKYAKWHMVKSGENLNTIAARYNTNISTLRNANGLRKNSVKPGMVLKLPKGIALAKE